MQLAPVDVDQMRQVYGWFNATLRDVTPDSVPVQRVIAGDDRSSMRLETGGHRGDGAAGAGYWDLIRVSDDFLVCVANDYYDERFQFDTKAEMDMLSVRFFYAGEMGVCTAGRDDVIVAPRTASMMRLSGERPFQLHMRERQRLLSVTLHIRADRLWDEVGVAPDEAPTGLRELLCGTGPDWAQLPMTPGMNSGVMDILANRLSGGLRQRYLSIKAQELLCLFLEEAQHSAGLQVATGALHRQHRARLYEARARLLDSFIEPPSIEQLARQVGLNRTTLRQGFKEMFGETIADFCQNRRMTLARELLKDPRFSIAEVAEQVGYNQPTNFTAAFRRHFSVPPKQFRST